MWELQILQVIWLHPWFFCIPAWHFGHLLIPNLWRSSSFRYIILFHFSQLIPVWLLSLHFPQTSFWQTLQVTTWSWFWSSKSNRFSQNLHKIKDLLASAFCWRANLNLMSHILLNSCSESSILKSFMLIGIFLSWQDKLGHKRVDLDSEKNYRMYSAMQCQQKTH